MNTEDANCESEGTSDNGLELKGRERYFSRESCLSLALMSEFDILERPVDPPEEKDANTSTTRKQGGERERSRSIVVSEEELVR